jgi:putative PIN family toxin of toxin-antitoxin system
VRAVLDVNVLISALLSPAGAPARLLIAWRAGQLDVVVSPALLAELRRALAYPKIRKRIRADEAEAFVDWLARSAEVVPDPDIPAPERATDPGDDYLLALAADQNAILVTGDGHLLDLSERFPIRDPASFLATLEP